MATVPVIIAAAVGVFLTLVTVVLVYFTFWSGHSIETEAGRSASE